MNPAPAILALFLGALAARGGTLQQRIDDAPAGATLTLPAGEYAGPVVITKPLTLRAAGDATIRGDGRSHVVHIKSERVTIEGLRLRGSGLELGKDHAAVFVEGNGAVIRGNVIEESLHGIYVKKAIDCELAGNRILGQPGPSPGAAPLRPEDIKPGGSDLCATPLNQNVRGNGIHLWNSERITVTGNEIRDTRDGIYFTFTHHSHIAGNVVSHTRIGLHYMYSDDNVFEGNRFSKNSVGSAIMISKRLVVRNNSFDANVGQRAYGLLLAEVDSTRFEGNSVAGNTIGAFMQLSSGNTFIGNDFTRGYIGVRLDGSSDANTFSRNRFSGNLHQVEIDASLGQNAWSDGRTGNLWGHSAQIDFDGDGLGDVPHREADLLGELRRPFPIVALLSGSPALDLAHFAQQHATVPGVAALVDPRPIAATGGRAPLAGAPARRPFLAQLFQRLFAK